MKISWKKRLTNKTWWLSITSQIVIIVALFINGGHNIGLWSFTWTNALNNWTLSVISGVLVILTSLGIIIDPTTPGIHDHKD